MAEAPDTRYPGVHAGVVTDNKDPLGVGRVRVSVRGLLPEEGGGWFLPGSAVGAGPQRGLWDVPDVGSEVYVFFLGGDPDKGRYLGGHWRRPKGNSDAPTAVTEAVTEDGPEAAVELKVWQSKRFAIVQDDRDGKQRLYIKSNKRGEDVTTGIALMLEIDDVTGVMSISAPAGIVLRSLGIIDLQAPVIQIGGRKVLQGIPKPI